MVRTLSAAFVALGLLSLAVLAADKEQAAKPAAATTTSAPAREWQLVWSDEFDYKGLPDPNKWDYEEGFVRNNEPQYYTRARLENAHVENGVLTIEARKEKFKNAKFNPAGKERSGQEFADYTSASLITQGKASWAYGRMELRAKMPMGLGTWPAFWTLGDSHGKTHWPACGEIDIMEFWARDPNTMTSCVHYQKDGGHKSDFGKIKARELAEFHVYALEWTPERMDFFCDGQMYHTVPLSKLDNKDDNAFRKPHYILLNLALEGRGKKIDDSALPQKFVIDYVRVYKQK